MMAQRTEPVTAWQILQEQEQARTGVSLEAECIRFCTDWYLPGEQESEQTGPPKAETPPQRPHPLSPG